VGDRRRDRHGGFYLYRLDERSGEYVALDTKLLPAVIARPRAEPIASATTGRPGQEHTYLLVEMEASGAAVPYGPYTVRPEALEAVESAADADARDEGPGFSRGNLAESPPPRQRASRRPGPPSPTADQVPRRVAPMS